MSTPRHLVHRLIPLEWKVAPSWKLARPKMTWWATSDSSQSGRDVQLQRYGSLKLHFSCISGTEGRREKGFGPSYSHFNKELIHVSTWIYGKWWIYVHNSKYAMMQWWVEVEDKKTRCHEIKHPFIQMSQLKKRKTQNKNFIKKGLHGHSVQTFRFS